MGTRDSFDWHSAYRDVCAAYVRSQVQLDRLAAYIQQNFPHVRVPIDDRQGLVNTVIVLLSGLGAEELVLHCRKCGGRLMWRRTPLLPEPAGKWFHEDDSLDDHEVVVLWEGPDGDDHLRGDRGRARGVSGVPGAGDRHTDEAPAAQAVS